MNERMVKHLIKHIMDDDDEDREVVKTHKLKPEHIKKFAELEKMAEQIQDIKSRLNSQRDGLWAKIKEELDLYNVNLRFNSELGELEEMEERD